MALIGSSNPIGCIFAGLFYGAMKYGGSKLSIVKAPSEVVDIIMGCVILFIAIARSSVSCLRSSLQRRRQTNMDVIIKILAF